MVQADGGLGLLAAAADAPAGPAGVAAVGAGVKVVATTAAVTPTVSATRFRHAWIIGPLASPPSPAPNVPEWRHVTASVLNNVRRGRAPVRRRRYGSSRSKATPSPRPSVGVLAMVQVSPSSIDRHERLPSPTATHVPAPSVVTA